jgi:anti-sigma B factor antagonist
LISSETALSFDRIDEGLDTTLTIEGTFDALSTPQMRTTLDVLVTDQRRDVALDLTSLKSIDSSGVGAVVSLFKRVRAHGGRVRVKGLQGQPLEIFRLLRLDRVLA